MNGSPSPIEAPGKATATVGEAVLADGMGGRRQCLDTGLVDVLEVIGRLRPELDGKCRAPGGELICVDGKLQAEGPCPCEVAA